MLYDHLRRAGFEIIFKPVTRFRDSGASIVKGNIDAELVLHTMIQFPHFEHAIIISGDGDFYCLIEYLVRQQKMCWILIPNRHRYSALLRKFGEYRWYMNAHFEKFSSKRK